MKLFVRSFQYDHYEEDGYLFSIQCCHQVEWSICPVVAEGPVPANKKERLHGPAKQASTSSCYIFLLSTFLSLVSLVPFTFSMLISCTFFIMKTGTASFFSAWIS